WMAAGLVGLLLVKGPFVLFGLGACVLWILVRGRGDRGSPTLALRGLILASAAVGGAAWAYVALYRGATGQPFWSFSLGRQLGVAAAPRSASPFLEKAYNLVWYAARVLWFAFPWSVVLAAASVFGRRRGGKVASTSGARDGLVFVLLLSASFLGAFSLSDRRADRYIFPVYYAVAAAGVVVALRAWPRLRDRAELLDRWHPGPIVGLWALTFALHFAGGWLGLPIVKIWAPDR
ncbi:MAG TPA: hypothetical protein VIZ31_05555, partial [Vicinamibacteria bacterium]